MKRIWAVVLLVMLCLPASAMAEGIEIPAGEVVELVSGERYDFWGSAVKVEFAFESDEYCPIKVHLRVGNAEAVYEGSWVEEKVYAALLDGYTPYILVGDYGPSDDSWTEIYHYDDEEETLISIGGVGDMPENLILNRDGTFSGMVRAQALYTWFRPADFKIAQGYLYGMNGVEILGPAVVEIPRYSYAMGALTRPTMDIPVCTDTDFDEVAFTAKAGEQLIFVSTDDASWVMVACKDEEYYGMKYGYIQLDPEFIWTNVLLNGESYSGYEIFPGLLYAD